MFQARNYIFKLLPSRKHSGTMITAATAPKTPIVGTIFTWIQFHPAPYTYRNIRKHTTYTQRKSERGSERVREHMYNVIHK